MLKMLNFGGTPMMEMLYGTRGGVTEQLNIMVGHMKVQHLI